MNNILYLEGASGISGDMTVAALLSLGASADKLRQVLDRLPLKGYHYHISEGDSYGIAGVRFKVHVDHGQPHSDGHHYEGEHRGLKEIFTLIEQAALSARAKDIAKSCFRLIAIAEAKAHGCHIEEVHFHEVGAVDSIVHIIAVAVLIDDLGITECVITGLTEGSGTVHGADGILPVPVPAVVNIASISGIPLRPCSARGEMITPTGIALATTLRTRDKLPDSYRIEHVGVGLGQRDFGRPNCLRAMLIEDKAQVSTVEQITVIECNIDDSTGEELGFAIEQLLAAGARDAHAIPCLMKKGRPAYLLRIICTAQDSPQLEQLLFSCTSTRGLRKYPVERSLMAREHLLVTLPEGEVQVKKCRFGTVVKYYPEYESVRRLAISLGNPARFRELYQRAAILAAQDDAQTSH